MANISPFRGTRYDAAKAGSLSKVIAMPYDRIRHGLQDDYYNRSEHNICRVIKGREYSTDSEGDDTYSRAAQAWGDWVNAGVVVEDQDRAIYAYNQVFDMGGNEFVRRGFVAMVELEDYESGGVRPHERTHDGPKADRLKLLKATNTHFGQIFQLYCDDENTLADLLAEHTTGKPLAQAGIPEQPGVTHKLWAVTDPTTIAAVQETMAGRALFIADGHHRYETALNYRNAVLREWTGGINGHGPRYAMMTLVGMSDPGLTVLPTHRVLHSVQGFDIKRLTTGLAAYFKVDALDSLEQMQLKLRVAKSSHKNGYGLYCGGKYWYFELKPADTMAQFCPKQSSAWRSLDVAVLHEIVLERILNISKQAQAAKTNISYEREVEMVLKLVDDGSHQAAVFMNPTKLEQIREVAGGGEVMPQKSTDFYPKMVSGMVSCQVDLGKRKN